MTQARNDVRQAAAFARRLVCRALTVVGGVAAGTALAWVLSSANASAETPADVPAAVQEIAAPAVEPVEQAADSVAQRLQDPPPPPPNAITDLGQKVKDAAEQFRGDALPELPACGTTCLGNERHDHLGDVFGRSALPTTPAPAPAATTAITPGAAIDALVPGTAKDRALTDGMSRRGSPAPALPALPDLPNWPAPWSPAPVGFPSTGNLGSAGNSADSHLFAVLPRQARGVDLVAGGIAAATDTAAVGRIGAQPGVAPD